MSDKNWLIRTHQKQILGPVVKEKIIEFIEKGNLTDKDEISSGSGYWFWVGEKELLKKYVYEDIPQTFNPINEAGNTLTINGHKTEDAEVEDVAFPGDGELEYPDIEDLVYPDESNLGYPDLSDSSGDSSKKKDVVELAQGLDSEADISHLDEELERTKIKKKSLNKSEMPNEKHKKKAKINKGKSRNDRYLLFLVLLLTIVLFGIMWYFKTILNKPFPIIGINSVQAQDATSLSKKKN